MIRRTLALLVILATSMFVLADSAPAAQQCVFGSAALDQYCQTLPGAGGPQGTLGGAGPTLAQGPSHAFLFQTLPRRVALTLWRHPQKRALLALPAAYPRIPLAAVAAGGGGAASLPAGLIAALAASAVGLAAAAAVRHRRGPAEP